MASCTAMARGARSAGSPSDRPHPPPRPRPRRDAPAPSWADAWRAACPYALHGSSAAAAWPRPISPVATVPGTHHAAALDREPWRQPRASARCRLPAAESAQTRPRQNRRRPQPPRAPPTSRVPRSLLQPAPAPAGPRQGSERRPGRLRQDACINSRRQRVGQGGAGTEPGRGGKLSPHRRRDLANGHSECVNRIKSGRKPSRFVPRLAWTPAPRAP